MSMGIKYTISYRSLSDKDIIGYCAKVDYQPSHSETWKITTPFRIGHIGRRSILLVKTKLHGRDEKTKDVMVKEHLLTIFWTYPLNFVCGCIDHSEDLHLWKDV